VSESARKKVARHIPSAPERILDAPELLDDYYLNLLDWSANNVLAIALGRTVYLWDATSASITELCALEGADDCVTSLSWIKAAGAQHIAVGTNRASVQVTCACDREFDLCFCV
jgi:cell division cycle protein 20 (cofactor of APC complex)